MIVFPQKALAGNLEAVRAIAKSVTLHDAGAGVDNSTAGINPLGISKCGIPGIFLGGTVGFSVVHCTLCLRPCDPEIKPPKVSGPLSHAYLWRLISPREPIHQAHTPASSGQFEIAHTNKPRLLLDGDVLDIH